jgi:hypothetical protein
VVSTIPRALSLHSQVSELRPRATSSIPPERVRVSRAELIELLAAALGRETSEALVQQTATRLQLPAAVLNLRQALALLQDLRSSNGDAGLVSVAARLAQSRLQLNAVRDNPKRTATRSEPAAAEAKPNRNPTEAVPSLRAEAAPLSSAADSWWTVEKLADLLSGTLGQERSVEVIRAELEKKGMRAPLTQTQSIIVMDRLGQEKGVVGVVARFAKRRISQKP